MTSDPAPGEDARRADEAPRGGAEDAADRDASHRSGFVWSLVDQGFSSATSFLFMAVAARALGPAGLGTVALGYAAFLIVLGLERSLIVNPLLARVSASSTTPVQALRAALSTTLAIGSVAVFTVLTVALLTTGPLAEGLLVFAPWMVPALLHALLRAWLYREERGRTAAVSNAVWLVVLIGAAAAGLRESDAAVVAAWGIGGCAALVVVASGTRSVGLARPRGAAAWFVGEAAAVGSWLAGSSIAYSAAAYARVAGISSILGTAALGGFRAVETAFAPVSLVGPALMNPGLPMMRDIVERRPSDAWNLALKISGLSFGLVGAYVAVVTLGQDLVFLVFGERFRAYQSLIVPVALGQVVLGAGTGFTILLMAARRMRDIGLVVLTQSSLVLVLGLSLALAAGLEGAAWGFAAAEVPSLAVLVALARRVRLEAPLPVTSPATPSPRGSERSNVATGR